MRSRRALRCEHPVGLIALVAVTLLGLGYAAECPAATIASFLLDTDPGWSMDTGWAFGAPTGGGGQYGYPDPVSGHTGANVYGYNLNGDYENDIFAERYLTTSAIDCSHYTNVHLTFWRWLGVEQPAYDHAYVEVSNDGSSWSVIWQNTAAVTDSAWTQVTYDISAVADEQQTVYLRWGLGPTDSSWQFCGWNIDDTLLTGDLVPSSIETYRFERMWPTPPQPWYFKNPMDVALDKDGNVYIADSWNNCVQKFDSSGRFLTKWGNYGSSDGQFNHPVRVAADGAGNIYVADAANTRIQKFDSTGVFVTNWNTPSPPSGIAVGNLDSVAVVYVAFADEHVIRQYGPDGKPGAMWGGFGDQLGRLNGPSGVAVDAQGFAYVADTFNHRIQKFTPAGEFMLMWGSPGSAPGEFVGPFGVTVNFRDNLIYVADMGNYRIQTFSPTGLFVTEWGSQGTSDGQFASPYGISADTSSGRVYVADSWNNRSYPKTCLSNNSVPNRRITCWFGRWRAGIGVGGAVHCAQQPLVGGESGRWG